MALSSKNLKIAIKALAKQIKNVNVKIRLKAAKSLGELGSEEAIFYINKALGKETDFDVIVCLIDAIIPINNLPHNQTMSETPQGNKYNIVQPQNVQIVEQGGGIIHNYATQQNLTEAAQEIQKLLTQLSQTYPTNTEAEKQIFITQVNEEIKTNSNLRSILISGGIELIKILCPPLGIPIEMGRKWLETAQESNRNQ
ncbi:HEAT repeat domain-containing protein [Crocosphaera sp. XPORK-15E]|uniref:HEAT repeat domain-containing protein n=1 Tax=Crocosphaera sp. XPORK-15E TaxID=3110247 RepID=UPI002B1EF897|nr:HEAT repeat domain-containing protein [Crocosphaera sp. XPORK-15E]MEA5532626.1 HEAT repeat domain-containing protein [Crocosphaera sp. XPORK-15E]